MKQRFLCRIHKKAHSIHEHLKCWLVSGKYEVKPPGTHGTFREKYVKARNAARCNLTEVRREVTEQTKITLDVSQIVNHNLRIYSKRLQDARRDVAIYLEQA